MPFLLIKLVEIVLPPLIQAVVSHYSKKEQTPEVAVKLQAHQTALDALKGPTT